MASELCDSLVIGFLSVLLAVCVLLEYYHTIGCINSLSFHRETVMIAKITMKSLTESSVRFWLSFGSLLFFVRGQAVFPASDTDFDLAVDERTFGEQERLLFTKKLESWGYCVIYSQERRFLQVYRWRQATGPHSDVWIYGFTNKTDEYSLTHDDYTIHTHRLPVHHVYPLKEVKYLDETAYIPNNAAKVCELEYGPNFMTPRTTRMECLQNVANGFTFYGIASTGYLCVVVACGLTCVLYRVLRWLLRLVTQAGTSQKHEQFSRLVIKKK